MIHMLYNIGVIGDYKSICGFSAVGFDVFPVESAAQAKRELKRLASGGYGIVYITEQFLSEIAAAAALYDEKTVPCVVPIPSCAGASGFGMSRLAAWTERATGSDII